MVGQGRCRGAPPGADRAPLLHVLVLRSSLSHPPFPLTPASSFLAPPRASPFHCGWVEPVEDPAAPARPWLLGSGRCAGPGAGAGGGRGAGGTFVRPSPPNANLTLLLSKSIYFYCLSCSKAIFQEQKGQHVQD